MGFYPQPIADWHFGWGKVHLRNFQPDYCHNDGVSASATCDRADKDLFQPPDQGRVICCAVLVHDLCSHWIIRTDRFNAGRIRVHFLSRIARNPHIWLAFMAGQQAG